MKKNELIRRYLLFIFSLFIMGVGIVITRHGDLGVSPISSVANVVALKLPVLTFGTWLFIWNCVMLLGQILLLRRNFKMISLLQIPLSVLFGWFTDIGTMIASRLPADIYPLRILMVLLGTAVLAVGITMGVTADAVLNSGEAFVKALSDTVKKPFGNVKIVFDISCVAASIVMSLLFFGGKIVGTREGTVIAALTTGLAVKLFTRLLRDPLEKLLEK